MCHAPDERGRVRSYQLVFNDACNPEAITALLAELDAAQAGIEVAVLAERERCAVICDEMGEHWCAYKDTAQLNGDIALSIAASGEPRAAEALAALIRTGVIREVKP